MSSIRVTFNRPLTYAEIESFREEQARIVSLAERLGEPQPTKHKWHFQDDRSKLVISSATNSRSLYQYVANWAEYEVVNLHPKAVLTYED